MKTLIWSAALAAATLSAVPALAQSTVYVQGHTRSDGTYVQGHNRTAPNSTVNDNWSTRPNVNPYTGKEGTRAPDTYSPYRSTTRTTSQRPR